jgi:RNA polymerase sigma factor (sigma-70 family)
MAGNQSAVLRRVVRTVAEADQSVVSDRELLRRYARDNDQAAFEALVRRHTGMVLGVCRRALPRVQDAEDACQATFLLLARKVGGVRWQSSAVNWLYATARRVAANARVAAERRAKRESRAAVPEAVEPADRLTVRELIGILDEELSRLSPRYREAVVLCHLEGLTLDEAARRLGVPVATLKTRVVRARKLLADALTGRGCALGIGLLTLAVTSPAGASPPRLVESILAVASGSAPAAVAELVKGVVVNGSFSKVALALAAVVVVALGVGMGSLGTTAANQPQPPGSPVPGEKDQPKAPAKPAAKEVTATGRVLNPDGKPLASAKLYMGRPEGPLELGASDADGKFNVKVPVPAGHSAVFLIARADGVGMDLQFIGVGRLDGVELRTVTDNPIRGKIVDTQGKPVAGATVAVSKHIVFGDNSLDEFLDGYKRGVYSGLYSGGKAFWCETGVLPAVTTDKDGKFEVTGVGAERLAALRVSGSGLAVSELWVANRKGFDPKPYNESKPEPARRGDPRPPLRLAGTYPLHAPDLSVVSEPEKRIRGTVKDVDTGKPRAGVKVTTLVRFEHDSPLIPLSAVTDAEGKYEIHGARKALTYLLSVPADPDTRHVAARLRAEDTAGFEPVTADIKVKKGVVVTGKVIDTDTKKPVRGFATVTILHDNKFVKGYPEFELFDIGTFPTDENGVFRIVTIPGRVLLMGGSSGGDALTRYKPPIADPKYPQYFGNQQVGGAPGATMPGAVLPYIGVGGNATGVVKGNFCKVLEIKADAETVTQDILLEPVK